MVPFGIDKEKLFLQIERLRQHICGIKETKSILIEKKFVISALERNLQLAIEDCLNIGNHIISGLSLKHRNFNVSSLADKFRMLLLTFFSENKQKNHKSSPRRGEDLEKGYPCEGLGDLSPNYLEKAR